MRLLQKEIILVLGFFAVRKMLKEEAAIFTVTWQFRAGASRQMSEKGTKGHV